MTAVVIVSNSIMFIFLDDLLGNFYYEMSIIHSNHDYVYSAFSKWKVTIEIVKVVVVCFICLISNG